MMEDFWLLYLAHVKQKPDRQCWIVFATVVLLSISPHMAATVCLLQPEDSSDLHSTERERERESSQTAEPPHTPQLGPFVSLQ